MAASLVASLAVVGEAITEPTISTYAPLLSRAFNTSHLASVEELVGRFLDEPGAVGVVRTIANGNCIIDAVCKAQGIDGGDCDEFRRRIHSEIKKDQYEGMFARSNLLKQLGSKRVHLWEDICGPLACL
jgi:hypothetical protein